MAKILSAFRPVALVLSLLAAGGCSLAPFSPTNSARSLGTGNASAEMGNANSNYFIRTSFGLAEQLDLGYVMEFGSGFTTSGLFGKYAFINNPTGFSAAAEGGYGGTETSTYYYAGGIASLAFNESFEVFINARYNQVETYQADLEVGDAVGNLTLDSYEASYILATVGFNLWMSENFGLSLFGSQGFGEDITWENGLAMGGSFLLKL